MKLAELERFLRSHGRELYREEAKHALWRNRATGKTTSVPRHREVKEFTVRGICRQLQNPEPRPLNGDFLLG